MFSSNEYLRQTFIGLALFVLILASLLVLHIWSVFFIDISWANSPLVVLLMAVQCWLFVGFFITAHDAMHGSLAPGRQRLNSIIGGLLLYLYAGFGWRKLKTAHMEHHAKPGSADDPDFHAENPQRLWSWYWLFMKRYFGPRSALYVLTVVLVYQFVLGADALNVILFYGIPSIASSLQLFYFGTYLPHRHGTTEFTDHHNARSNDYPVWWSLLTCYHFGYHHEHHLFPHEPWWRLPARRAAFRAAEVAK